jgi:hypothetical protein
MSSYRPLLLAALLPFVSIPHALAPERRVQAGTALALDLESAVARADLVVEGRVASSTCVANARGRIETRCTLALSRTFFRASGDAGPTLELRLPGGVLPDGRGLVIPGLPTLAVGDEVVLVLSPESRAGLRLPIGLAQGVLRVVRAADGSRRLSRDARATELVGPAGERRAGTSELLDYAAAVARIEAAAAARRRDAAGGRR